MSTRPRPPQGRNKSFWPNSSKLVADDIVYADLGHDQPKWYLLVNGDDGFEYWLLEGPNVNRDDVGGAVSNHHQTFFRSRYLIDVFIILVT